MFKIGSIVIDSIINESVAFTNEITSKAVEKGEEISDNINHKPLKVQATCIIAGPNADKKYQELKLLSNSDVLVTYYGSLEPLLENMAIESVGNKRDVAFGDGFEFDINLVQIKVAQLETFQYRVVGGKIEADVINKGKTPIESENVGIDPAKLSSMLKFFGVVI